MSATDVQALLVPEKLTRPMQREEWTSRPAPTSNLTASPSSAAAQAGSNSRRASTIGWGRHIDVTLVDRERMHVWKPKLADMRPWISHKERRRAVHFDRFGLLVSFSA